MEAAGIFIEIDINEQNIKKLLNFKFDDAKFRKKVGYYFSELLYDCQQNQENVFIFNYDKKLQKCFIAYLRNRLYEEDISLFPKILTTISSLKNPNTTDYAIVATTYPEVLSAYQISSKGVKEITPEKTPEEIVKNLSNKFWFFSENNDFPEPQKALKTRNYFYKNFKNYYEKYLTYIEETQKPEKISKATKETPYNLFGDFYTYDNKVYEFRTYNNQVIELPKADPLSLTVVAGFVVDKNYVFDNKLTKYSPPNNIKTAIGSANNPKAIWEWYIMEGIHGGSFQYVKEKWDTIYWKDKNAVYIQEKGHSGMLKKVEDADPKTFEYLDGVYGRDKNHLYRLDRVVSNYPDKYPFHGNTNI